MTAVVIAKTKGLTREQWLTLRRRGIGGTDAAAVAGLSRWKSPLALWLEKTDQLAPRELGEAAAWGIKLEDIVAREFTNQTGLKVKRRKAILGHPQHQFMLANLDRIVVGERAGLECKTTSQYNQDQWEDKIPPEYQLQCQHYLAVTGYTTWYIAVLIGGQKFIWRKIKRDQELIDHLIQLEATFWHQVKTGLPPAADGMASTSQALHQRFSKSIDSTIELPSQSQQLIQAYQKAREAEEEAKAQKDQAANQLKQLLGEQQKGLINQYQVNWKTIKTTRLDTKALKQDHPEIYAQYAITTSSRRFSIK